MPLKQNIHKRDRNLPPTILTIFGSTGDLTADYLMPALLHMDEEGLFPKEFKLVCVGRKPFTTKQYIEFITKKSGLLKKLSPAVQARLLKKLIYYQGGEFDDKESFEGLAKLLADHDLSFEASGKKGPKKNICYNRLYYFATSPEYFGQLAELLKTSGLLMSCTSHDRSVRVLVEKPFGSDEKSARSLNQLLLKYFTEEQIYRIDHYQGKETVQNLMVVRFANSIFEPLWNNRHIDHIEISVLEKDTVGHRAAYYDQSGALKDMVQNHILQMLSLIAMEEPRELTANDIRNEKLKILKALVPFTKNPSKTAEPHLVLGQYQGYTKEIGHSSQTETFAALKVFIKNKRWDGVPFYLRTGKALPKKVAEISVHFKEPNRCIFTHCAPNILTFRIQPDESVTLQLNNKVPGFGVDLHQGKYEFGYSKAFMSEIPTAYERLILDFLEGDQRLFIRSDEIEAAWKFVDSAEAIKSQNQPAVYEPGSDGPQAAEEMLQKDAREWRTL